MATEAKETKEATSNNSNSNSNSLPALARVLDFDPTFTIGEILELDPKKLIVETEKDDPLFDPSALENVDIALSDAIKQKGFNSLVLAVERSKGKLTVVAGRKRRTAAELAGEKVKVLVMNPKLDDYDLVSSMIGENVLRTERSPIQKARYAAKLMELGVERFRPIEGDAVEVGEDGVSYNGEGWRPTAQQLKEVSQDVARKMGVTTQYIKNHLLPLVATAPKVQKAIEKGDITVAQALTVKDKPFEKQEAFVEKQKEKAVAAKAAVSTRGTKAKSKTRNSDGVYPTLQFKRPVLDAIYNGEKTPLTVKAFLGVHLGYKTLEDAKLGWLGAILDELMDE